LHALPQLPWVLEVDIAIYIYIYIVIITRLDQTDIWNIHRPGAKTVPGGLTATFDGDHVNLAVAPGPPGSPIKVRVVPAEGYVAAGPMYWSDLSKKSWIFLFFHSNSIQSKTAPDASKPSNCRVHLLGAVVLNSSETTFIGEFFLFAAPYQTISGISDPSITVWSKPVIPGDNSTIFAIEVRHVVFPKIPV